MEIKEIISKEIWENFLSQCEEKTFLDSWNWGEFQRAMGNKVWSMGVYDNNELVAAALVIGVMARRGRFLFVPHGPNIQDLRFKIKDLRLEVLGIFLEWLKRIAKEENASFIRIAPIFERNADNKKIFRDLGVRNAPTHMHPEVTWELDITPPEEEILAGMRKTTRYLIRQAQKNQEIEISQRKDIEALEEFYKLHQETVSRHHFTPFSLDYIKKEFQNFIADDQIVVFHGKYRGELVASAIIVFWQDGAYYHHGATSMKYPKIPVAQFLQWQIIREAKRRGCTRYNFWGIAPDDSPSHPWRGLTLFKTGFGGHKKEYVKTQDLPLSWRYWPVAVFELLRRKKRGL